MLVKNFLVREMPRRKFVLWCAFVVLDLFLCCGVTTAQPQIMVRALKVVVGDSVGRLRLAQPLGMSVDAEGNIYIADTGNHRVLKCNAEGELVKEAGGFGFGEQQFDRPVEVWVDNSLNVFVADYNNQRLQRYDKDLNFISSYASDEALEPSLRFGYPAALAISPQGELFVADHEFNRVLRFDAFGNPKASFGDFNWGEGRLERPTKIFISQRGEIWVSDSLLHALMKYDAFGNFMGKLQFDEKTVPSGIAEWAHGLIVTDLKQHALLFLSETGERLFEFSKYIHAAHELAAPAAVIQVRDTNTKASGEQVRLLVLDSGNHRVLKFEVQWRQ